MTIANTDRKPRGSGLQNHLADLAAALAAKLADARRRRIAEAYLRAFTARDLRDLGLSRDEVRANSDAPIFGPVRRVTMRGRFSNDTSGS